MNEILCRGSISLSTACLKCRRCKNEIKRLYSLEQQLADSKAECDRLKKEINKQLILKEELYKHEARLKDEIHDLHILKFTRFNNEECWIYQEDGDNYLETLVCPVVIRAKTLLKLIKPLNK